MFCWCTQREKHCIIENASGKCTFSVKQLVHRKTVVTAVSLQSSRECLFVDVWLQRDNKHSTHHVGSVSRLVAGISSVVNVSRSASVHFLIIFWPCHNRMCFIAKRRRAFPTGSRMQGHAVTWIEILEIILSQFFINLHFNTFFTHHRAAGANVRILRFRA